MAEVVEWVGHSEAVALKHYQRSIDADFTTAASGAPKLVTQLDTKMHEDVRNGENLVTRVVTDNAEKTLSTSVFARHAEPPQWSLQDSNL